MEGKAKFLIVLVSIVILVTLAVIANQGDKKNRVDQACCDEICGKAGLTCLKSVEDTAFCLFNYANYGMPEIDEVFQLRVQNVSQTCYGGPND